MNEEDFILKYGETALEHCPIAAAHPAHEWTSDRDVFWCGGARLQEVVELPPEIPQGILPSGGRIFIGTPELGDDWRANFKFELSRLLRRYAWDARCNEKIDVLTMQILQDLEGGGRGE